MLETVLGGLVTLATDPVALTVMAAGLVGGLLFGTLPGVSGLTLATLLLPVSAQLEAEHAILLFAVIYAAGVYGGAITSILFNIPGDANDAPATFDGYPMTLRGRAAEAIGIAMVSSAIGGLASAALLIFATEPMAYWAVRAFGPPEILALVLLGLIMAAGAGSAGFLKGLLGVLIGLLIATIGLDPTGTTPRFTFGLVQLEPGVTATPLLLGFFAISEILVRLDEGELKLGQQRQAQVQLPEFATLWRLRGDYLRSIGIGFFAGVLPGVGATLAAFLAYAQGKRRSRDRAEFGHGTPAGLVCSETAKNAATGATMVPLFALGLPGGAFAAVMLASFQMHGIEPGPLAFVTERDLIGLVFAGFAVANLAILALGYLEARLVLKLLHIPFGHLAVVIILSSVVGAYSERSSLFDVAVMFAAGFAGYALRNAGISAATLVLGVVLGAIGESAFVKTIQLLDRDWSRVLDRPIMVALLAVALAVLAFSLARAWPRPATDAPRRQSIQET